MVCLEREEEGRKDVKAALIGDKWGGALWSQNGQSDRAERPQWLEQ